MGGQSRLARTEILVRRSATLKRSNCEKLTSSQSRGVSDDSVDDWERSHFTLQGAKDGAGGRGESKSGGLNPKRELKPFAKSDMGSCPNSAQGGKSSALLQSCNQSPEGKRPSISQRLSMSLRGVGKRSMASGSPEAAFAKRSAAGYKARSKVVEKADR